MRIKFPSLYVVNVNNKKQYNNVTSSILSNQHSFFERSVTKIKQV